MDHELNLLYHAQQVLNERVSIPFDSIDHLPDWSRDSKLGVVEEKLFALAANFVNGMQVLNV